MNVFGDVEAKGDVAIKRQHRIYSSGRGQPTAPQAVTVQTMTADIDAHKHRSRTSGADFPVGSITDHDMLRGELVFGHAAQTRRSRAMMPNYQDVPCFTAFNGLSSDTELVFYGTCDKEWIASQRRGDDAVTVRTTGTATIINYGNETIYQGSLVAWDWPLTYTDSTGTVHPRVEVRGVPPTKFYPSLVPVDLDDVFSQFTAINISVVDLLRRSLGEADFKNAMRGANYNIGDDDKKRILDSAEDIWPRYSMLRGVEDPSALMHLTSKELKNRPPHKAEDPVRRFTFLLLHVFRLQNDRWKTGGRSSDEHLRHKNAMAKGDELRLASSRKRFKSGVKPIRQKPRKPDGDDEVTVARCFQLVAQFTLDQQQLLYQRVIGKALSTAAPGKKFDIHLGLYHR